jgi:hypothetical protein
MIFFRDLLEFAHPFHPLVWAFRDHVLAPEVPGNIGKKDPPVLEVATIVAKNLDNFRQPQNWNYFSWGWAVPPPSPRRFFSKSTPHPTQKPFKTTEGQQFSPDVFGLAGIGSMKGNQKQGGRWGATPHKPPTTKTERSASKFVGEQVHQRLLLQHKA